MQKLLKQKQALHQILLLTQIHQNMKKQFILVLIATFVVGIVSTYGQLTPRTITCLSADALHPIAGTPYTYEVSVPTPPGTKTYLWRVTQDQTFITNKILVATPELPATSDVLAAAGANYNVGTVDGNTISLTWKSFVYDPANPVFVIISVVNDNGTCSPNNMKVYKIQPINAFTLDIANLDNNKVLQAGYGSNIDRCISDIVSADYDATAPEGVVFDFGADTLYYEVVAANWSDAWLPSVTISGYDAEETIQELVWSTTSNFATTHSFTLAAGVYTSADNVVPSSGSTVGATGESIYLRLIIDHSNGANNYEGLTAEQIAVAVDGITMLTATPPVGDVHYDNGPNTPPCPALVVDGFTNDIAYQTITPRPDVQAVSPTPFLPVKP
jgi:hypothetical protein